MSCFGWTAFDVLAILSCAFWGKQYYFQQENGIIYSRDSGKYMTLDEAIAEFSDRIGDDGISYDKTTEDYYEGSEDG